MVRQNVRLGRVYHEPNQHRQLAALVGASSAVAQRNQQDVQWAAHRKGEEERQNEAILGEHDTKVLLVL